MGMWGQNYEKMFLKRFISYENRISLRNFVP